MGTKINPVNLVHELPCQKRRYKRLAINPYQELNKLWGNKRSGFSVMVAGGTLLALLFFFFLTILHLFVSLFIENNLISLFNILSSTALSLTTAYFFILKKDKYLSYFNEFERWTKIEKEKYRWATVCLIVSVILFFVLSIKY